MLCRKRGLPGGSAFSYHIVNIDSPNCSISCKNGQLSCRAENGSVKSLPLEDVASIVVTSFSAQVHTHLLLEAGKHGVPLIICEKFKPVSLLLPANRSTDTLLTKAELALDARCRASLWQKTIDAKCQNQHALCALLAPGHPVCARLKRVASTRSPAKESTCARYYWQVFGSILGETEFKRIPGGDGLNSFLNYGYAVLLSSVLQKLLALGLDPTFGIAHAVRERSAPLAYDLMEPFRPCVDRRVIEWLQNHPEEAGREGLSPEFRRGVAEFALEKVGYFNLSLSITACIESVVRSFRKAVMAGKPGLYKPWTASTTKWAG